MATIFEGRQGERNLTSSIFFVFDERWKCSKGSPSISRTIFSSTTPHLMFTPSWYRTIFILRFLSSPFPIYVAATLPTGRQALGCVMLTLRQEAERLQNSLSPQPQHILHIVKTVGLGYHPEGSPARSSGKVIPAVGPMDDLQSLTDAPEEDGVFANNISCPDHLHPDLVFCPPPPHSLPPINSHLSEIPSYGRRDQLS